MDEAIAPETARGPSKWTRWLLMLLAAAVTTAALATVWSVWYRPGGIDADRILQLALTEYMGERWETARRLAEQAEIAPDKESDAYRLSQFLRGAAGVRLADEQVERQQKRAEMAAAIPYLQWNAEHGYPPARSSEGEQLLGRGLLVVGRFAEAVRPLEAAIGEDPTLARDLLLLLAEAKLQAPSIDPRGALPDVDRLLEMPNLRSDQRDDALLVRGRVLTALGNWDEARRTIDAVQSAEKQGPARLATAELLIARAHSLLSADARDKVPQPAIRMLDEAIEILDEVSRQDDRGLGPAARYLAGRAHRIAGRGPEALGIFANLRQSGRQTAEAIAAGVEELELLAEMGQYEDVVLATRATIREIGDPQAFDARWLSLPTLKSRLAAVGEKIRGAEAFDAAVEFAKVLPPVFAPAEALQMQAQGHRQWGNSVLRRFNSMLGDGGTDGRREGRRHLRDAGDAYAEAARVMFTEAAYTDLLWQAIDSYQAGRAYARSLELLDDYLRYESRQRKPRGLIAQGRARLAIGQPRRALLPLVDCIEEYPRDSLRYEARLLAAVARAELGDVDQSRQLLEGNLFDGRLAPSSPVYRDSLFILGELLFRHAYRQHLRLTTPAGAGERIKPGDHPSDEVAEQFTKNQQVLDDAILRLDQAAHRDKSYGNDLRSRRAAYLAAEAHQLAAFWPGIVAEDPETLESARRQLRQQRTGHLTEARQAFAGLRTLLNALDERDELMSWEPSMLRNCYLAEADMLFELGQTAEAAEAYQNTAHRFLNEPLALEALLRQGQCFERLGRSADAQRVLQQAARVLERIPAEKDAGFAKTTRYDRPDWISLLEWLQKT